MKVTNIILALYFLAHYTDYGDGQRIVTSALTLHQSSPSCPSYCLHQSVSSDIKQNLPPPVLPTVVPEYWISLERGRAAETGQ